MRRVGSRVPHKDTDTFSLSMAGMAIRMGTLRLDPGARLNGTNPDFVRLLTESPMVCGLQVRPQAVPQQRQCPVRTP